MVEIWEKIRVSIGSLRLGEGDTDDFVLVSCESDTRDSRMLDGCCKTDKGESSAMWKEA